MYNNYYDGNAKYGVGSTMGSSIYIENNYFRNCKYPMLSSNQGTDALGEGTFSGENGGIIKAYGNEIVGATGITYANATSVTGEAANSTTFDAYLAFLQVRKYHHHTRQQQVVHHMITLIQLRTLELRQEAL